MRKLLMFAVVSTAFATAAMADEVTIVGEIRDIGVTDILVDTSTGNQRVEVGPMEALYRRGVTLKMRDFVKIKGHTMADSDVVVAERLWVRGRTVRNLADPYMMRSESMSGKNAIDAANVVYVEGEIRDIGVDDILVDTSTGNKRVKVGSMDEFYRNGVTLKMRDFVKIKGHKATGSDDLIAERLWVRGTTVRNLDILQSETMSGRSGISAAVDDEVYVIGEIRDIGVDDILVDTPTGNKRVDVGSMEELYRHGVTLKMRDYVKIKGHSISGSDDIIADRLWVRGRTVRNLNQPKSLGGAG